MKRYLRMGTRLDCPRIVRLMASCVSGLLNLRNRLAVTMYCDVPRYPTLRRQ